MTSMKRRVPFLARRGAVAVATLATVLAGGVATVCAQTPVLPGTTASGIAPRLPAPELAENAPPKEFLLAARQALAAGRGGEALEALERAESRALTRSVVPSQARTPSAEPLVRQIAEARTALIGKDRAHALQLIDAALKNPEAG